MHIPDGIVPTAVAAAGYGLTAALTWYSLRKIDQLENPREHIPKASLLAAAFFVASWIHIPIPPTSVHLILNGLLGAILGYFAFPAILIGLLFQAILFQHGGLTTLGLNAFMLGGPALVAHFVFQARRWTGHPDDERPTAIFGFLAGATGIALSTILFYTIILTTMPAEINVAAERAAVTTLSIAHIPLMVIEGVFTALLAVFLTRVKPELLRGLRQART